MVGETGQLLISRATVMISWRMAPLLVQSSDSTMARDFDSANWPPRGLSLHLRQTQLLAQVAALDALALSPDGPRAGCTCGRRDPWQPPQRLCRGSLCGGAKPLAGCGFLINKISTTFACSTVFSWPGLQL
ncbi:hypothetical protein LX32DRAFT_403050 [Colletotrichum zoysiae]|uniref:Uncharacterized protein n=1 Tax=Colletotrichum zoysiae TaxID=1216348 RepID=A0AAD9LZN7_9PEZI|nr:hypothetical protein LX32DRAFT_403050 [Colletotrichum zoysiae]